MPCQVPEGVKGKGMIATWSASAVWVEGIGPTRTMAVRRAMD